MQSMDRFRNKSVLESLKSRVNICAELFFRKPQELKTVFAQYRILKKFEDPYKMYIERS